MFEVNKLSTRGTVLRHGPDPSQPKASNIPAPTLSIRGWQEYFRHSFEKHGYAKPPLIGHPPEAHKGWRRFEQWLEHGRKKL